MCAHNVYSADHNDPPTLTKWPIQVFHSNVSVVSFLGAKELLDRLLKFYNHIPNNISLYRRANDFKDAKKIENGRHKSLKFEIILILQSHSQQYGDVKVIFSRFTEIQNGHHGSHINF